MKDYQTADDLPSSSTEFPTPPQLDLAALEELRLIMDDEFSVLLTTFVQDSADRINELEASRVDWTRLRRAAHSFKGSSSNIGAMALSQTCLNLEIHCQNAELAQQVILAPEQQAQIGDLIAQISEELTAVQEALTHRFPDVF